VSDGSGPPGDRPLVPEGFRAPLLAPVDHCRLYDFARLSEGWCPYPGHPRLERLDGEHEQWGHFRWCPLCLVGWSYDPWGPTVGLMPAEEPARNL
jgi:hypothetical protein